MNGHSQYRASSRLKASPSGTPRYPEQFMLLSVFLYVSVLAQSRGFGRVVGILELVWVQASKALEKEYPGQKMGWQFQDLWALETPDLCFRPKEVFACVRCFPDVLLDDLQKLGPSSHTLLNSELNKAARNVLGAELMSTVFLVKFLQLVHHPLMPRSESELDNLCLLFGTVFDFGVQ